MTQTSTDYEQAFVRLKSRTGDWLVSEELRPRLVADAAEQETNLTEVALAILAERHRIKYAPAGRRTTPRADDEVLNLRVPGKLARAIRVAAARSGRQWLDQIRWDLQDHYGLVAVAA